MYRAAVRNNETWTLGVTLGEDSTDEMLEEKNRAAAEEVIRKQLIEYERRRLDMNPDDVFTRLPLTGNTLASLRKRLDGRPLRLVMKAEEERLKAVTLELKSKEEDQSKKPGAYLHHTLEKFAHHNPRFELSKPSAANAIEGKPLGDQLEKQPLMPYSIVDRAEMPAELLPRGVSLYVPTIFPPHPPASGTPRKQTPETPIQNKQPTVVSSAPLPSKDQNLYTPVQNKHHKSAGSAPPPGKSQTLPAPKPAKKKIKAKSPLMKHVYNVVAAKQSGEANDAADSARPNTRDVIRTEDSPDVIPAENDEATDKDGGPLEGLLEDETATDTDVIARRAELNSMLRDEMTNRLGEVLPKDHPQRKRLRRLIKDKLVELMLPYWPSASQETFTKKIAAAPKPGSRVVCESPEEAEKDEEATDSVKITRRIELKSLAKAELRNRLAVTLPEDAAQRESINIMSKDELVESLLQHLPSESNSKFTKKTVADRQAGKGVVWVSHQRIEDLMDQVVDNAQLPPEKNPTVHQEPIEADVSSRGTLYSRQYPRDKSITAWMVDMSTRSGGRQSGTKMYPLFRKDLSESQKKRRYRRSKHVPTGRRPPT